MNAMNHRHALYEVTSVQIMYIQSVTVTYHFIPDDCFCTKIQYFLNMQIHFMSEYNLVSFSSTFIFDYML